MKEHQFLCLPGCKDRMKEDYGYIMLYAVQTSAFFCFLKKLLHEANVRCVQFKPSFIWMSSFGPFHILILYVFHYLCLFLSLQC